MTLASARHTAGARLSAAVSFARLPPVPRRRLHVPASLRRSSRAVVVVAAAWPVVAPAQTIEPPALGMHVRVLAPPVEWRRGELLGLDSVRLVLRRDGWPRAGRVDSVPLRQVRRLEMRRPAPNRRTRAVVGSLLGGLAGAAVGLSYGVGESPTSSAFIVTTPLGGVFGAALGAGVGLTTGRRWVPIPLPAPGGP